MRSARDWVKDHEHLEFDDVGAEAKGPPVTGWRLFLVCIVSGALLGAIAGFGMRKRQHGGRRPNAGHPVTTGMASVPPVFYRVSKDQRAELDKEGKRRGLSGNQVAKLRAFPVRKRGAR